MTKRGVSILCVLLLLLGGCAPARPQGGETTATTAPAAPRGERIGLSEAPEDVREFVTALCDRDTDGLQCFTGDAETAALLATVKVTDYALEAATDTRPLTLLLEVSESSLPAIPVGHSEWWFGEGDREYFSLRLARADTAVQWIDHVEGQTEAVAFCHTVATNLQLFDTVADTAALSPTWVVEHCEDLLTVYGCMAKWCGEEAKERVTSAEMSAFCEQVLGVQVEDFSAATSYADGALTVWGRGGAWYSCALQEYTQTEDTHTVTIRFFADNTGLVEAATVRYVARAGEHGMRLCAVERLSGSDLPPRVWYM